MITKEKWQKLSQEMSRLGINENDIIEKFIIGSGSGGQKLHKTASKVFLKDQKTGIIVTCQDTRNREDNRYLARKRLCEKIKKMILGEKTKKEQELAKIKRQKQRRRRKTKLKILADKNKRAEVKKLRKKIDLD